MHGALGLAGWQWLFLIEGGLASVVGVWAFWHLDNRPADARWLDTAERNVLAAALEEDARDTAAHGPRSVLAALFDRRVLALALIYLLIQISVYGVIFYLPQQVAALLGTKVGLRVGLVTALPWLCAVAVTWWVPRRADRAGGHRSWAVLLLVIAGIGIGLSGVLHSPAFALVALCCAASGFIAAQPLFWTFPTRYLTGAAAAGGIALINSLGSLGGFVAPTLRTSVDHAFPSTSAGLIVLGSASVLAALLIGTLFRRGEPGAASLFHQPIHRARQRADS